jgi:hypothetical protein
MRTASGPSPATSSDAFPKSRSPTRIAVELSYAALTLGTASAHQRLVHDVVVVERGEVGELDTDGCSDDLVGHLTARERGEDGQRRPEPLAAGREQVPGRLGDERIGVVDGLDEQPIDPRHGCGQGLGKRRVTPGRARTGGAVMAW